jgi:hypothetical protein
MYVPLHDMRACMRLARWPTACVSGQVANCMHASPCMLTHCLSSGRVRQMHRCTPAHQYNSQQHHMRTMQCIIHMTGLRPTQAREQDMCSRLALTASLGALYSGPLVTGWEAMHSLHTRACAGSCDVLWVADVKQMQVSQCCQLCRMACWLSSGLAASTRLSEAVARRACHELGGQRFAAGMCRCTSCNKCHDLLEARQCGASCNA